MAPDAHGEMACEDCTKLLDGGVHDLRREDGSCVEDVSLFDELLVLERRLFDNWVTRPVREGVWLGGDLLRCCEGLHVARCLL